LVPYDGATGDGWIDTDYMVTDEDGNFIDVFFGKSAIVYGYDSFGLPFSNWLDRRLNITSGDDLVSGVRVTNNTTLNTVTSRNVSNTITADMAKVKKRLDGSVQNKESDGYYIDKKTQEENAHNTIVIERRKEVKIDVTTIDQNDTSRQESMYYPGEPNNVTTELKEQKIVPVDESHEKEIEGKSIEEASNNDAEENAAKNAQQIPAVPVDVKFEIP